MHHGTYILKMILCKGTPLKRNSKAIFFGENIYNPITLRYLKTVNFCGYKHD